MDARPSGDEQCERRRRCRLAPFVALALAGACVPIAPAPAPAQAAPPPDVLPGRIVHLDASTAVQVQAPPFRPVEQPVRTQLLARGIASVRVAPEVRHILLIRGRGATLLTPGASAVRIRTGHLVDSAFSPAATLLAVAEERSRITIVTVPEGRVLAELRDASEPRWLSEDRLRFRRQCQPMIWVLGQGERPDGVGRCGRLVRGGEPGRSWYVAGGERLIHGAIPSFTELHRVDLDTGDAELVLGGGASGERFSAPRLSPDGRRLCWVDGAFALRCRQDGVEQWIWPSHVRRPVKFDDSGRRLMFAVEGDGPNDDLYVIDFAAELVRRIPRGGRQAWSFLPGGRRLVGHGGRSRAVVFDLVEGWYAEVGHGRDEWEGFWPVPDDDRRFVVGHERGGTRDLYWVELPP